MLISRLEGQPLHKKLNETETEKMSPSVQKLSLKLGNRLIPVTIYKYGTANDVFCFNMHDNEFTSVQAAKEVLSERGGTLMKIENFNQRIIRFKYNRKNYSFDANRIFSPEGIGQTLRELSRYSIGAALELEKFAKRLLSFIPDSASCLVALHNNFNSGFSVNSYTDKGKLKQNAREVFNNLSQDEDDIVFTTDSVLFKKMSDHGYNSIYQDNINAKKDGTLSVYYGEKEKRYINIETEHGRTQQYVEMLTHLFDVLKEEKIAKSALPPPDQANYKAPIVAVDN